VEEGLVGMKRVRELAQEATEHMQQWHDASSRERERLRGITEEAAAALGQEHLDGEVVAAPANVVDLFEAVETESRWLKFGWLQGCYLCQQRIHAANSKLLILLEHLQSTLDTCCDEGREAEARMEGVEEAIADPHKLLLEKIESHQSEIEKLQIVLLTAEWHHKCAQVSAGAKAKVHEAKVECHNARGNVQKCLREFREILAEISRLSVSFFPELPFCMKQAHLACLSGDAKKASLAQQLFISEPEVAALFAGHRDTSHYTNVEKLSRTPDSRHDVDRASFDGEDVVLKKYNLQNEASMKTLRDGRPLLELHMHTHTQTHTHTRTSALIVYLYCYPLRCAP
jgi:hypothetical protein